MHNTFSWRDSKVVDTFKPVIFTVCRFITGLQLKIKSFFSQRTKTILLVGTSEITVDFLLEMDEILKDFGDKQTFMLVSKRSQKFAQTKLLNYPKKITLISLIPALCLPWGLIVFADHNNVVWFHPDIPKIYYSHGLEAGKSYGRGGNYAYGQNSLSKGGDLVYDLMFVDNSYNRDIFLRDNPALEGKLAVIGNLMADKLVELNQKREVIRRDLSIQEDDQILVVFSTWGPHSLIQRFGKVVLDELPKITHRYKIYIFVHPLNDGAAFVDRSIIFELLEDYKRRGIAERVDPKKRSLPYLVAADIVLTDHSSLSLYYALLGRPFLFVPFVDGCLMKEALNWKFYELQEKYNPNLPLSDQLDWAIKNFPAEEHEKLARLVVDERGQARQRIRDEIAKFL